MIVINIRCSGSVHTRQGGNQNPRKGSASPCGCCAVQRTTQGQVCGRLWQSQITHQRGTLRRHGHVASEDSRRQESKPDEEQFQLLFLLSLCTVFSQCLFTVCVRLPMICHVSHFFAKNRQRFFFLTKTYKKRHFAGRATRKSKRKRH